MASMPPTRRRTSQIKLDHLDIRRVPVEELQFDLDNARAHSEANLAAIEKSLRAFGQRKPLVVASNMTVIAGNGTLAVIRDRLQWLTAWVSVFPGTAAEARAYGIADNRTGELASWNQDLLAHALADVTEFDATLLAATGYSADRLEQLMAAARPKEIAIRVRGSSGQPTTRPPEPDDRPQTLSFDYCPEVFEWLTTILEEYRLGHGLDTFAQSLVAIAAELTGQTPPRV